MAGRSAHVRQYSSETRSPGRGRRSSSHGDAARDPVPGGVGGFHDPHDLAPSPSSPSSPPHRDGQTSGVHPTSEHAPKLLGFLGDMLQLPSAGILASSLHSHSHAPSATPGSAAAPSAQRSATTPITQSLLPPRSHSRAESAMPRDSRDGAHSPLPGAVGSMAASGSQQSKIHGSPSKASRTYDSKLVSREMHRLGNLAHLPSLTPSLSAAPSSITLNMAPPSAPNITAALSTETPWASLHVLVLPLFNDEPLRVPIEDLNQLVKRHISTVVSAAPGKAVAALEHDTAELVKNGMVTLNSKLSGVENEKLIPRVVELWTFFWTGVLPYLEGALLPLQTDPILSSLYRLPKTHRSSSPTSAQNAKASTSNLLMSSGSSQIDVRALALVGFRDLVILPLFPKLHARLTTSHESQQARLQQMLLVLVSQRSQRLVPLSLTAPPPPPSAGEAAVTRLLRSLHAPLTTPAPRHARPTTGAPSFLSAGLPRDRRGRIAQKTDFGSPRRARDRWRLRTDIDEGEEGWEDGDADTPKVGISFADPVRERDKELLESLRSPDPDNPARMSIGGWGLGAGREDEKPEEDEEDENLDWDQAQAIVEHMVGIAGQQDTRRRAPVIEGYKV